jgi:hypothetical protein
MMPPEQICLIVTDFAAGRIKPQQLEAFLRNSRFISDVMSPIPLVYLVRTSLDLRALSTLLHPMMDESRFLVTPLDLRTVDGWLPKGTWEWFVTGGDHSHQGAVHRLLGRDH